MNKQKVRERKEKANRKKKHLILKHLNAMQTAAATPFPIVFNKEGFFNKKRIKKLLKRGGHTNTTFTL